MGALTRQASVGVSTLLHRIRIENLGSMLWSIFLAIFANFLRKIGDVLENQRYKSFFCINGRYSSQNRLVFYDFWQNILKIITLVPEKPVVRLLRRVHRIQGVRVHGDSAEAAQAAADRRLPESARVSVAAFSRKNGDGVLAPKYLERKSNFFPLRFANGGLVGVVEDVALSKRSRLNRTL
jgi:hypothetical protein